MFAKQPEHAKLIRAMHLAEGWECASAHLNHVAHLGDFPWQECMLELVPCTRATGGSLHHDETESHETSECWVNLKFETLTSMEMLKTDIWESMKQWRCWKLTSESIESMKQRIAEHRLRPSIHLINFKASPCQFFLMAHQTTSMRWTSSWADRWRRLRNKANPAFWISVIVCNIINHEPWNSYCRQDTRSTT